MSDSITVGTWEFSTLIHELGHAVGLSHPFGGSSGSGTSLPSGINGTDSIFYTAMSYTDDPSGNNYFIDRYPETPMLLDIQALQYLYGANMSHNSSDTIYTFTGNEKYFETIWDGGGEDTIDYRSSTTGATIDLREGEWSSLGKPIVFTNSFGQTQYTDPRTVWIAYGTEIENAWGSSGADQIIGNSLDNTIAGYAGDDELVGMEGRDSLWGGSGNDWLAGGSGDDYLDGGDGAWDAAVIELLPSQYSLNAGILSGPEGNDTLIDIERIYFDFDVGDSTFLTYIDLNEFIDPDGIGGDAVSGVTESLNGIADLYVAYFNRAPDPDGLSYWFVEINNGTLSLVDTAKSFTDQQEYRDTYPEGLGNREFIQRIYQNLFDREPDQAGWDYWENDLDNGLPRDTFILTIIYGAYGGPSAGDKSLLNNKHDASMYYSEQLTLYPEEGFDANISEVLNNVTADSGTVISAMEVVDYAMDNPITVTGIVENQGLWDFFWA